MNPNIRRSGRLVINSQKRARSYLSMHLSEHLLLFTLSRTFTTRRLSWPRSLSSLWQVRSLNVIYFLFLYSPPVIYLLFLYSPPVIYFFFLYSPTVMHFLFLYLPPVIHFLFLYSWSAIHFLFLYSPSACISCFYIHHLSCIYFLYAWSVMHLLFLYSWYFMHLLFLYSPPVIHFMFIYPFCHKYNFMNFIEIISIKINLSIHFLFYIHHLSCIYCFSIHSVMHSLFQCS